MVPERLGRAPLVHRSATARCGWVLARRIFHIIAAQPGVRVRASDLADAVQRSTLAIALMGLVARRARRGRGRSAARTALIVIRAGLAAAAAIHLAAGSTRRCNVTARIMNLAFRDQVRRCQGVAPAVYFVGLLEAGDIVALSRELRECSALRDPFLNRIAGEAFMQDDKPAVAETYFRQLAEQRPDDYLAHRLLGGARAALGRYGEAAQAFERSVALFPASVMAYQNAAGRYDTSGYRPPAWELAEAGRLLVYDTLARHAETLTNGGLAEAGFVYNRKMLDYQAELAADRELPADVRAWLEHTVPSFDPALPTRIMSYEWVTQIGHVGMLASQAKMAALGMLPRANRIVLAPAEKVANEALLAYFEPFFGIVRTPELVRKLLPHQRWFGDGFLVVRTTDHGIEPWTIAAARAEAKWTAEARPPLLQLTEADQAFGQKVLQKLAIPPGAPIFGLHVRERGFHREAVGGTGEHRNADIDTYLSACAEIMRHGGHVLRLGDRAMRPIPRGSGIIDYATSRFKSPQMDIFLLATCRLIICTTSGLTTAAQAFGTPMLLTNCISSDWQFWPPNCRYLVKQIYDRHRRRHLSLAEIYRPPVQGLLANGVRLHHRGLDVRDNTAEEIRSALIEVLDGNSMTEDAILLARYREALRENPLIFGSAVPAASFLAANPHLLPVAT